MNHFLFPFAFDLKRNQRRHRGSHNCEDRDKEQ